MAARGLMTEQGQILRTGDLLLVEDTPSLQMLYRTVLRKAGYPPVCASTGQEALEHFATHLPRVVLLDLMLPDTDGLSVMAAMLRIQPETRVIVISANGSVSNAVEATRRGAHDFLVKPLGDLRMVTAVANALNANRRRWREDEHAAQDLISLTGSVFLGQSPAIMGVQSQASAVAASQAPVFLLGESGTGKCACAELIHGRSPRATRKMVIVKCRGTEARALERTLFGDASASDASSVDGALAQAQGSSLLLDHPQEMPLSLQDRLLQVLERGSLTLPGQSKAQPLHIRLICSSEADPRISDEQGKLRAELLYRLFVITLHMPPLRERAEDIPLLAQHFLGRIAQQEGKSFTHIAADALAALAAQKWPGNLREFANLLRQIVVLNAGPELTLGMLKPHLPAEPMPEPVCPVQTAPEAGFAGLTMAEIERRVIEAAIARHGGSVPQAARELDLAPSTIYRKREAWSSTAR